MSLRKRLPLLALAACTVAAALPAAAPAATTDASGTLSNTAATRSATITLTGADRTVTAGSTAALNLANASVSNGVTSNTAAALAFCLGQTTINWGDGTIADTTAYVPILGFIISPANKFTTAHLGPSNTPKTYTVTVTAPARQRPSFAATCNTAGSNTVPTKTFSVTSEVTVVPPGPDLTLTRSAATGANAWYTTPDGGTVSLVAKDPDGLKPLTCTDAVNGAAPVAKALSNEQSTNTILNEGTSSQTTVNNTGRTAELPITGEGRHHIACTAEDTGGLKTVKETDINIDLTDPTLTVDPEFRTDATNANGRTFNSWPNPPVHALDNLSGATATCTPTALTFGWNDVTCSKVTDGAGHVVDGSWSFRVYLRNAGEQLLILAEYVRTNGSFFVGNIASGFLRTAWGFALIGDNARACQQLITASGLITRETSTRLDKVKYALDALRIGSVLQCQI